MHWIWTDRVCWSFIRVIWDFVKVCKLCRKDDNYLQWKWWVWVWPVNIQILWFYSFYSFFRFSIWKKYFQLSALPLFTLLRGPWLRVFIFLDIHKKQGICSNNSGYKIQTKKAGKYTRARAFLARQYTNRIFETEDGKTSTKIVN